VFTSAAFFLLTQLWVGFIPTSALSATAVVACLLDFPWPEYP
jgi:hypothetical protein